MDIPDVSSGAGRTTATRARILAASLEVFTTHGYGVGSMNDVARTAGLTKQGVYYHFASKEELLAALVDPLLDDLDATLATAPPRDLPGRAAYLSGYLEVLFAHRSVLALLTRDRTAITQHGLEQRLERHHVRSRRHLAGRRPTRYREIRASAALSTLWRPVTNIDLPADQLRQPLLDAATAAAEW